MLLVSEQIELEIGVKQEQHQDPLNNLKKDLFEKLLDNSKNIEDGRTQIRNISNQLVPYYDRALKRYLKQQ